MTSIITDQLKYPCTMCYYNSLAQLSSTASFYTSCTLDWLVSSTGFCTGTGSLPSSTGSSAVSNMDLKSTIAWHSLAAHYLIAIVNI